MPPRNVAPDLIPVENDVDVVDGVEAVITEETHEQKRAPLKIVWRNVLLFAALHLVSLYSLTLIPRAHPLTWLFSIFMYIVSALGVTAGCHRLWSHRSYRAKLPMRILLAVMQTSAFQNHIFEWSRDHRVHHKYSETDADPHNAKRGFFFAHMGWLMAKKHPDVISKGKLLDTSDLLADPVVRFQMKYYKTGVVILCFVIPTFIPHLLWGESLWNAFYLCGVLRYCLALNATWLVNSAAHMWGNRPYDKRINPRQNSGVSFSAVGEGFHNYHHTFPHDYATSEYGWHLNITTAFIDIMAWLGQASNRKRIPMEVIMKRKERTGDGTD